MTETRRLKVLVAAPQSPERRDLLGLLEDLGAHVVAVVSMRAMVAHASSDVLDLALVSMDLSDGSGLELIPAIKARFPGVRAIALARRRTSRLKEASMESGALDLLRLPVRESDLRRILDGLALELGHPR
jgi:DNA-binding NtrC family response regulator